MQNEEEKISSVKSSKEAKKPSLLFPFLTLVNRTVAEIDKARSKRSLTKTEETIKKRCEKYLKIWTRDLMEPFEEMTPVARSLRSPLDFRQRPITHIHVSRFPVRPPMMPHAHPPEFHNVSCGATGVQITSGGYVQDQPSVMSAEEAKELGNKYSIPFEEYKKKSTESECPICMENLEPDSEICLLSCNHPYHKRCIVGWFMSGAERRCPYCRKPLM